MMVSIRKFFSTTKRAKMYLSCGCLLAVTAALFLMFCAEDTPDYCGDGRPLNTHTEFCSGGEVYQKCDGKEYDPLKDFCYNNALYDKCGGNEFSPVLQFCAVTDTVLDKCGGQEYNPAVNRCVDNKLQANCGNLSYDTLTQFCHNNIIYDKCRGEVYNPDIGFCDNTSTDTLCGGRTFTPATEFCFENVVYNRCGGQPYDPTTQGCVNNVLQMRCGNIFYDFNTQFCHEGEVLAKCGGAGGLTYNPRTQFCYSNAVLDMCGGLSYNPTSHFCHKNTNILELCNGQPWDPDEGTCSADGVDQYMVTVVSDTGLTSPATGGRMYTVGATVNITAGTPPDNRRFVRWTTGSAGVSFANANSASTSFTMPASGVTVTAVFEQLYWVRVTSGEGTVTGGGKYYGANDTVRINATTIAIDWRLKEWTDNAGGSFNWVNSVPAIFTMPATVSVDTVTVTAVFEQLYLGTFTDTRPGANNQVYHTVLMPDGKTWMAENLNYAGAGGNLGSCYNNSADSCTKYGRLYTWATVMNGSPSSSTNPSNVQGICPSGWHVPSDAEWTQLVNAVNTSTTSTNNAGRKLKSQTGWNSDSPVQPGTNEYGFSALPGGYGSGSNFYFVDGEGSWWTTMGGTEHAWCWYMSYGNGSARNCNSVASAMRSLRCVRDD